MVITSGKATVLASAPGVVASLDVTVAGMTTGGSVVLTLAERDSQGDTRGQPDFYAVTDSGKFTITCEEDELQSDTDIYWVADTDGTGALAPDATADGTYVVYNDGSTPGQVTGFTVLNGLITAVTVLP